jgi:phospholipid/cholesterol/gamma-HCH transport system substrate-binding protein
MARRKDRPRVLRKDRTGANPVLVGGVVLLLAAVGTYFGFTKHVPFTHGFRVQAVIENANSIRANSPVRIAGVNVGKVKGVERQAGSNAAIVKMEIQDKGLPIHKDATLKIRPRIFLEGNFFVDLKPGTPSTPTLGDNDTIPITQTSSPVQFDQVLGALQGNTRDSLKTVVDQFGSALADKPTAAQDAAQDPSVRGKTAAQALNASIRTSGDALKNAAIVNDALLGSAPHDLSGLIVNLGTVTKALDRNESQLQSLITNFNTTVGAFAAEKSNLRQTIRQLGPTLQTTNRTLASLNSAFPATRAFAREILPGVRETPATINAAFPWLAQANKLLSEPELRGLVNDLSPTTANLSKVVDGSLTLLPQADLVAQCLTNVILPAGDVKINEGGLSTNTENYKEFWYAMVGLAGESSNFDANGLYVHFQTGGGDQSVSTGKVGGALGDVLYGNASTKPMGTRPAYPGHRPPYVSSVPCKDAKVPDFNGAGVGPADGGGRGVRVEPDAQLAKKGVQYAAPTSTAKSADDSVTAQIVSRLNPFRKDTRQP